MTRERKLDEFAAPCARSEHFGREVLGRAWCNPPQGCTALAAEYASPSGATNETSGELADHIAI